MNDMAERTKPHAMLDGQTLEFRTQDEKFRWLAEKWLDSQSGRSRIDFNHPAHIQIIGMGPAAIPFLLVEIQSRSGHWFEALRAIVGTTPVSPEIRGDFEAVTAAWLKWGTENGYEHLENGKRNVDATAPSQAASVDAR